VAKRVVESCLSRAGSHREKKGAEYKTAAGLADAAEKQKSLDELNKPLDKLYHELTRRVDSLVTLEQKIAVDGEDSVPRAQPRKPRKPRTRPGAKAPSKPAQTHKHTGSGAPAAKAKPAAADTAKKPAEKGKPTPKAKAKNTDAS